MEDAMDFNEVVPEIKGKSTMELDGTGTPEIQGLVMTRYFLGTVGWIAAAGFVCVLYYTFDSLNTSLPLLAAIGVILSLLLAGMADLMQIGVGIRENTRKAFKAQLRHSQVRHEPLDIQ